MLHSGYYGPLLGLLGFVYAFEDLGREDYGDGAVVGTGAGVPGPISGNGEDYGDMSPRDSSNFQPVNCSPDDWLATGNNKHGFCASTEQLFESCTDLEISAAAKDCSNFSGNWCCYNPASLPEKKCGIPGAGKIDAFFLKQSSTVDKLQGNKINDGVNRSVPDRNNQPNGSENRLQVQPTIIGGFDALLNQICWQAKVNIQFLDEIYSCGGTIIGYETILTAAHCFFSPENTTIKAPPGNISVHIGAMDNFFGLRNTTTTPPGCAETYQVTQLITHENYDLGLGNNDIALLTLNKPIDFLNKPCACPICLTSKTPAVGETCFVSGTGFESETSGTMPRSPRSLKWVRQEIRTQSTDRTCAFHVNSARQVTDLHLFICAGKVVGEDSCAGDSGGPLFCLNTEQQSFYSAGIISFGLRCALGVGGQNTKVSLYLDWIFKNSKPNDVNVS